MNPCKRSLISTTAELPVTPGDGPLAGTTPVGSLRHVTGPPPSEIINPVEDRLEAVDMPDEEVEDILRGQGLQHLQSWLITDVDAAGPSPSPNATEREADAESPTLSEPDSSEARPPPSPTGSEFDDEYDDEFDTPDRFAPEPVGREMPSDEEVDSAQAALLNRVDRVMDRAQSALPGVDNSFVWTEDFGSFNGRKETFTVDPVGPTAVYLTPYDAFAAIWDEGIIRRIASETNRYASQRIEQSMEKDNLTGGSRVREETDADEVYVFIAVLIIMGYDPKLKIEDYWRTDNEFDCPKFRDIMSYDRYVHINKFLHFTDNSAYVEHDKKSKLQPIIDHCNARFQSLYVPSERIAIGESLTLWKGRLSWVQCIRSRTAGFGVKSFELCESTTGYLWRFVIYAVKDSGQPFRGPIVSEIAQNSTAIVLQLLEGLEHKGYHLTMDNLYNSPVLARHLKTLGFDCSGTLRVNRKYVPDAIKLQESVPKGTIATRHSGDVVVMSWKDAKVVHMVSTFHTAETYSGTKRGGSQSKPAVVHDYNSYMGGVDLKDRKLSVYLVEHKRTTKWYVKMFRRLLNVSIHNALVIYRASCEARRIRPLTHRRFRVQLVRQLLEKHKKSTSHAQPAPPANSGERRLRKDLGHAPKSIEHDKRQRCARCASYSKMLPQYKVRKVSIICIECKKGLCIPDCWLDYHQMPDLSVSRR